MQVLKSQAVVPTLPSDRFSPYLVQLVQSMMSIDPAERPSADDICRLPECCTWAQKCAEGAKKVC